MSTKRAEAWEAIAKANPLWSKRHIAFAYEMMPTSTTYAFPEGSLDRARAHATWLHHWTTWAVEMNILPGDTIVPPMPETSAPVARVRAATKQKELLDMALFTVGFETEPLAAAHAKKFGAAPVVLLNPDDGLFYPATYPTTQDAYRAIKQYDIAGGWPMGLRADGKEYYALGMTPIAAPSAPRAPRAPRATGEGRADRPEQNGITRPGAGTCADIWDMCDALTEQHGRPVTAIEIVAAGDGKGLNVATVKTQFAKWRKFMGHPK